MTRTRPHKKRWQQASSFQEMGELTALWIEGKIPYYPLYVGGIDPETGPLVRTLAELNRNGYVTTCSQPGEPLTEDGYGQRAFVFGYATEGLARRLEALTLFTGLLVIALPPGEAGGYPVPVTLDGFHPHTWCGHLDDNEGIEFLLKQGIILGSRSLMAAWRVCVIDLQWGREEYLWDNLRRVINDREDRPSLYHIN